MFKKLSFSTGVGNLGRAGTFALVSELALSAALAVPALAQTNDSSVASALQLAALEEASSAAEEIVVAGEKVRPSAAISQPVGANQYVLNQSDFDDALGGNNALALVKDLPGVSYTATDALGVDISDVNLFMRGFRTNELGIVFEGVPLNDTSYESVTGTSLVNIGVPNAVGSIAVAPGSARESTFSNVDNGGGLEYSLAKLQDTPIASVSQTYGSNNTLVTTASAQTGQIGTNGPKILADFQRISADKYQGGGTQNFLRGDMKLQQDVSWGDFTAFFSGSHAEIWGYDNISFDMIRKLGWNTDISYPNYKQAYLNALPQNAKASCGAYSCGRLAFLEPYDTGQTTSDYVGSLAHHFQLSPALSGSVQFYGASNATSVGLADPTTPSASGAPFSEEAQTPYNTRFGGTVNLKYVAGSHTVAAGYWLESTESGALSSWYNEPVLGTGAPLKTVGPYDVYGPAFQTANESRWRTQSQQVYLHDDYAITDELTLGAGFKGISMATVGGGVGPDRAPYGALSARDDFLPHLSVLWQPDDRTDIFADTAETEIGYRVAQRGNVGNTPSIWTVSDQATFDDAVKSVHPEQDWNFTIGAAHRFDDISITYDAYYSIIDNRMLSAAVGTQYTPIYTVGDVKRSHIVGTDGGVTATFLDGFHFYQGGAASRFFYDGDLVVDGTDFPIKGKAQPAYPIISLVSDLSFKQEAFEAGINSTEYLEQPFSYENDIFVPNYWQVNAHISYRVEGNWSRSDLSFRLDVSNLLDRHNIGTANVGGSPFSGDFQTLQRAAPRQVMFTISAKY